jgi:phage terminase large subunit
VIGADSNFPLPRAGVLCGFRGDGSVDIIDEFYQTNAQVEDLINWVLEWKSKSGRNLIVYHDPSDPSAIDKISTAGLIGMKADNKVIPGISEVSRYFENNLIRINSQCINLIKELQSYRWMTGKEGDRPVKEADHLNDATRYALFSHNPNAGKVLRQTWILI